MRSISAGARPSFAACFRHLATTRPTWPEGVRTAGAELTKMALLLARIRAWLTLQSPPSQETFPYHLAFRQMAEGKLGEFKDSGDFEEGEQYKLYLRAASALAARDSPTPRWVYVFVIDHFGDGTRVFPPPGRGCSGGRQSRSLPLRRRAHGSGNPRGHPTRSPICYRAPVR